MKLWTLNEASERIEFHPEHLKETTEFTSESFLHWTLHQVIRDYNVDNTYFGRVYRLTNRWIQNELPNPVVHELNFAMRSISSKITATGKYSTRDEQIAIHLARRITWLQLAVKAIQNLDLYEKWSIDVLTLIESIELEQARLLQAKRMLVELQIALDKVESDLNLSDEYLSMREEFGIRF